MKISRLNVLSVVAVMAVASPAFALDLLLTTTGVAIGGPAGALVVSAGTSLDLSATLANAKEAVVNAAPDAAKVLEGREATDAFQNGKAGAELILNTKFASDQDAAVAIIELAEAQQQAQAQ